MDWDLVQRPLDLLNECRGKRVLVILKDKKISGDLVAFDIHINLVLKDIDIDQEEDVSKEIFIKGDSVIAIFPADE